MLWQTVQNNFSEILRKVDIFILHDLFKNIKTRKSDSMKIKYKV